MFDIIFMRNSRGRCFLFKLHSVLIVVASFLFKEKKYVKKNSKIVE